MGDVLVFVEHVKGKLPKTTLAGIEAGKQAASRTGGACHAVVLGKGVESVAGEVAGFGVKKVFVVDDAALEHYVADAYTEALSQVVKDKGIETLVATSTAIGKDLLPRVAARLGAGMASDVVNFNEDGTLTRPMYAGNVIATVKLEGSQRVVSIRATAFDAAKPGDKGEVEKVAVSLAAAKLKTKFVEFQETKSDRPVLTEASIVVSGGRGLKNGENFTTYLEPLCEVLGAAMGASRAAVDAGFVPNDLQVGQTGKVVAPTLYIAVGISGAIQHLAGMKDSKTIVAINKDGEAPIFQVADYGLVADLFKAVPELTEEVKKLKHWGLAMSEVLKVEKSDGVATLTLNRPAAMNALSLELRRELISAFRDAAGDESVGVVILTGSGRAFCAGLDLKELGGEGKRSSASEDAIAAGGNIIGAMDACPKPIIGAINGFAITGGFELALACDLLIVSREARFADTHARVGILPGWGLSQKLPRLIGIHRAKELSLTGNFLSAEQAEAWGLVNRVVEPDALLATCRGLAKDMLSCEPQTMRGYKALIDRGFGMPFAEAILLERQASLDHAKKVKPADIAARRSDIQTRGRTQN